MYGHEVPENQSVIGWQNENDRSGGRYSVEWRQNESGDDDVFRRKVPKNTKAYQYSGCTSLIQCFHVPEPQYSMKPSEGWILAD